MSVPPSQARVEGGGVKAEEDTPPRESYHTATATIFMTDSLRHWQKLTRGVPLSPMRPSMMPGGGGKDTSVSRMPHTEVQARTTSSLPAHAGGKVGTGPRAHGFFALPAYVLFICSPSKRGDWGGRRSVHWGPIA